MSLYKPAPLHNPLEAPGVCLCLACCRIMIELRCPAVSPDAMGSHQCGDFKGHRGQHSLLVATTFCIAAERLATAENKGSAS